MRDATNRLFNSVMLAVAKTKDRKRSSITHWAAIRCNFNDGEREPFRILFNVTRWSDGILQRSGQKLLLA